jgi:hypothetical protein
MDISFLFPRPVVSAIAGLQETKNPAGKFVRLIQILLVETFLYGKPYEFV